MTKPKPPTRGKRAQPHTFETAIARLEAIVASLESGEETLDASLRLFEEAMGLCEFCRKQLEAAEGRVERLVEKAGGRTVPEPAEDEEE